MNPVVLRSARLVLDQPTEADVDLIAEYCADPVFERFMTTPWPYTRGDADRFVREFVPGGWSTGREATWALRTVPGGPLLGMIGFRVERGDLGYWLGALHRGHGYMSEAVGAVADWAFGGGVDSCDAILWEAKAGNVASAAVARRAGFRFTGTAPAHVAYRDGSHPLSWNAELRRDSDAAAARASWPAEAASGVSEVAR